MAEKRDYKLTKPPHLRSVDSCALCAHGEGGYEGEHYCKLYRHRWDKDEPAALRDVQKFQICDSFERYKDSPRG